MGHIMTVSMPEFMQSVGEAQRAAQAGGTVIVTDEGRPTMVLLSFVEYRRLALGASSVADLLCQPDGGDSDFDPEPLQLRLRDVDASS